MYSPSAPTLPAPDPSSGLTALQSIDQAATLLNVSRATILRLADSGDLAETRIGSRRLFTVDAIRAYVARATAEAQRRNEERQRKAMDRARAKEIVSRK